MIDKEKVVFNLKNFSNGNKHLDSLFFFERYGDYQKYTALRENGKDLEAGNTLKTFQRRLNQIVNEIIEEQKIYKEFVILSGDNGYWIPQSEEEYFEGENYLYQKENALRKKRLFIDEIRIKKFSKKAETQDLFTRDHAIS
jgi:hypothetical protein